MTISPDIFTHTFEFGFADVTIKGEVEFDTDDVVSMDITQAGIPLRADTLAFMLDFFDLIKQIKDTGGYIKNIKIKTKAV